MRRKFYAAKIITYAAKINKSAYLKFKNYSCREINEIELLQTQFIIRYFICNPIIINNTQALEKSHGLMEYS